MRKHSRIFFGLSTACALLLVLSPPAVNAQNDGPAYFRHLVTTVKPDRVAEFESLLRERAAALEAGGEQGFRSVWQPVQGPQYTYVIVDPIRSLAVLDEPPSATPSADWIHRVDAAITEQTSIILRNYPDLSIPGPEGYERDMARLRIRRTLPAVTNPYYQWQRDELVAKQREAGLTSLVTGRAVAGTSVQTWISLAHIDDNASQEGNIIATVMPLQERVQMFERGSGLLAYSEDWIVRFRPDLGFRN